MEDSTHGSLSRFDFWQLQFQSSEKCNRRESNPGRNRFRRKKGSIIPLDHGCLHCYPAARSGHLQGLWQPWSNGQDSGPPSQRPGFDSRRLHFVVSVSTLYTVESCWCMPTSLQQVTARSCTPLSDEQGMGCPQTLLQRMRPYSGESTPSRPIWEVKHQQAQLVLR